MKMQKTLGWMVVLAGLLFVSVKGINATETAEAPLQQISVQDLNQRAKALKVQNQASVAALVKAQNKCLPAVYTFNSDKPMTAQKVGLACCTSHGILNAIYCTVVPERTTCHATPGCHWTCS